VLGAALVVACALAFAVTSLRVDPRAEVLVLARPVAAGQVLTSADLDVARIVPDSTVPVIPASERDSIAGRTATMPLAARTLLSGGVLGAASWPPRGQSVIAVPVKPGRAPDGLAPGTAVTVLVLPSAGAPSQSPGGTPQAAGVVVAVRPADAAGTEVLSLLLPSSDALRVAGAAGEVAVVLHGAGG
jgi:hypothetical protein